MATLARTLKLTEVPLVTCGLLTDSKRHCKDPTIFGRRIHQVYSSSYIVSSLLVNVGYLKKYGYIRQASMQTSYPFGL